MSFWSSSSTLIDWTSSFNLISSICLLTELHYILCFWRTSFSFLRLVFNFCLRQNFFLLLFLLVWDKTHELQTSDGDRKWHSFDLKKLLLIILSIKNCVILKWVKDLTTCLLRPLWNSFKPWYRLHFASSFSSKAAISWRTFCSNNL